MPCLALRSVDLGGSVANNASLSAEMKGFYYISDLETTTSTTFSVSPLRPETLWAGTEKNM
jgi:hypothetical protein